MGLLIDKKQKHKCRVLTEDKLDDRGARVECIHTESLNHLSQETGVSQSTAKKGNKLLKLRPYKTTEIHTLQLQNPASRVHLCNWFLQSVMKDENICI
jgi:hypothetical protein